MTTFPEQGSASIEINAAPEVVWNLVAEITRMAEWSPECVRAEWESGATGPEVGAKFHGFNQIDAFEWDAHGLVTESEVGKVFEFKVPRDSETPTIWRFEFAADGAGTTLTESFDAPLLNVDGSPSNFEGRYEMLVEGIGTTVAAIKAAAEA